MARFAKTILAAGTYHKNGETIRVTPDDLQTALSSHAKITGRGYKIPVIMEHSKPSDKSGLPFKSRSEQLDARDLAKYQEGWSDTLRLNSFGELEADIDVKGDDGLKLIREVGTYISPQFGRWADPETGEVLPMAITHLALTPFPVDINQNADFRPLPESTATVTEASQLSHLVSFSMADLIDFGQKSFMFDESDHPRDHGKFTAKSGGSSAPADDEPFTLKKEKDSKFVPKKQAGIQTDLFGKTKTTVSPADSHVTKQAESLPGQKIIGDSKPDLQHMARIAAGYQLHGMNAEPDDREGSRAHQKHMTKSALDSWLMKKFGLDSSEARSVSNAAGEMNAVETSGSGTVGGESAKWTHSSKSPTLEELGDVPWAKPKQMSHFNAKAAVHEKLRQMSLAEQTQFGRADQKRADDGKWTDEGGGSSPASQSPVKTESVETPQASQPAKVSAATKQPAKTPSKKELKRLDREAEKMAEEHHRHAQNARKSGDIMKARRHAAAASMMHYASMNYEEGNHRKAELCKKKAAQFAAGEIKFPDEIDSEAQPKQMGQNMPFPPKSPSSGDVDNDDDGIVDSADDDFGTGLDGPDDGVDTDPSDDAEQAVKDHMPDDTEGDAAVFAQIVEALKLIGVIVPDATNAHALLAGVLTCAHHMQKSDAKEAMENTPDPEPDDQSDMQQPQQPPQQQQNPATGKDPRLAGTRQENSFTMSQAIAGKVKEVPIAEWTQMSHVNEKMSAELTTMKRDKYNSRIDSCFTLGKLTKPKCEALKSLVGTYQFSMAETSSDILKLETMLEMAEELPEGAVWSPSERVSQMSIVEQNQPGFFSTTGTTSASPEEENADIERRFGKFVR